MRKQLKWNAPLKFVMKDLASGNRKAENEAMRQLRLRFVGIDKNDQMKVIMHHLGRERSHREWAYARLLDLWDETFETVIADSWEQYHEEKCAWPIIRHFPAEYVLEHKDELSIGKNRPFVIRRLCEEKDYDFDAEELSPYEYIWILSTSGRTISADKAWLILVEATKEVCKEKSADDFAQGETFSAKLNKILFHLDKMGRSLTTAIYREWYKSAIDGFTDSQLWDWYRIASQMNLDRINHPYDILVEKIVENLPKLELQTSTE